MTIAFCTAVNIMANNYEHVQAVHPQLISDVWSLFQLQAIWYEEEIQKFIDKRVSLERRILDRWRLSSINNNDFVKLSWHSEDGKIMLYAQQALNANTEVLSVVLRVEPSLKYYFVFNHTSEKGWSGNMYEQVDNNKLKTVNFIRMGEHMNDVLDVWHKLPTTLKDSIEQTDVFTLEAMLLPNCV